MGNGLVHHVAIVSESDKINFDDVSVAAASVAKQVARDFGPAWGTQATVQAFGSLEAVPGDYYQVVLVDDDKLPSAAGYHTDSHGQPLAVVEVAGNWPAAVSHEVLEMLADPFGNRIVSAAVPNQAKWPELKEIIPQGLTHVDYLVEVCDPVQGLQQSYPINGVTCSDFVLPCFYTSAGSTRTQISFNGSVGPRSIEIGGYVTFRDPETGLWYQMFRNVNQLGARRFSAIADNASLRECSDRVSRGNTAKPVLFHFETALTPRHVAHAARTRSTLQKASLHGGASAK